MAILEFDLWGKFSWKLSDWEAARRRAHGSLTSLNAESQHRRPDSSESISRESPPTSFDLHRSSTVESEVRRCLQAQSRSHYLLSNKSFFQLVGAKRTLPKYRHSARGQRRQFGDVRAMSLRPTPPGPGVTVGASARNGGYNRSTAIGGAPQNKLPIPTNCPRSLWSRSPPPEIAIPSRR